MNNTNNNGNRQVVKRVKRKRNKRTANQRPRMGNSTRIPNVMPALFVNFMKYISTVIGVTSAAAFAFSDWLLNSILLPEVSGTDLTSAIGFEQFKLLYTNWLVQSAIVTLDICNEEDFEVIVCMAPTTYLLGSLITNSQIALQIKELPWGKSITLGRSSGQNRGRIQMAVNLSRLFGSRSLYHGDQNFIGSPALRPADLSYVTFSVVALSGNVLTNGVTFSMSIDYKVRWTNRIFNDIVPALREQVDPLPIHRKTVV